MSVQAERELVGGTVDRALSLIDGLSVSERDPNSEPDTLRSDGEEDIGELRGLRDQLKIFGAAVRSARHDLDPKIRELHQLRVWVARGSGRTRHRAYRHDSGSCRGRSI